MNEQGVHPFLLPGEWLVSGRFLDPDGSETRTAGVAVVTATEQFPELLEVSVELRSADTASRGQPEASSYHLEIVAPARVKFRMDSLALESVLLGAGSFTTRSLVLSYLSPDGRYVGFESFAVTGQGRLLACGSFLADSALAKTWEVEMERVPRPASG